MAQRTPGGLSLFVFPPLSVILRRRLWGSKRGGGIEPHHRLSRLLYLSFFLPFSLGERRGRRRRGPPSSFLPFPSVRPLASPPDPPTDRPADRHSWLFWRVEFLVQCQPPFLYTLPLSPLSLLVKNSPFRSFEGRGGGGGGRRKSGTKWSREGLLLLSPSFFSSFLLLSSSAALFCALCEERERKRKRKRLLRPFEAFSLPFILFVH